MGDGSDFFTTQTLDWRERLAITVEVMRELSRVSDPQAMQQVYSRRMVDLFPTSRRLSLSRRGLEFPYFRITRSSTWNQEIDPWKDPQRLPFLRGGLLAELLYADEPRIIDDLEIEPDDPAAPYLEDQQSLIAIPQYEGGAAINMVIATREEPYAFPPERFPDLVWMSNLFGRATQTALLSKRLQEANEASDHEMRMVAGMQQSLLPAKLPDIATLDLAAHYQTSSQAGGDYYDIISLPKNRWGILIADVSGHGALAAVLMAITHSLTKTYSGPPWPPGLLLSYLNRHLASHYTGVFGSFVTAFYAIYDPDRGTLTYANAGHPPPRLIRCADGSRQALEGKKKRLPLGISDREEYPEDVQVLVPGDQVIFCTDGILDATNDRGQAFGIEGLDKALAHCPVGAQAMVNAVLTELRRFTGNAPAKDDRTLIAAKFVATSSKY
ncbi:MAG: PP2C family protein-serine/threonine phosphatase [Planctomycetes bacterium]|nr:PP2C family protein-serine/threonine phosphatase [Planctomycetota bacterium]